mgnify:CR=1 FL=1
MNTYLDFSRSVFTKANHLLEELAELRDSAIFAMGICAEKMTRSADACPTTPAVLDELPSSQLNKKSSAIAEREKKEDIEFLGFTDEEISRMSKQFRKIFKTNGFVAHVRKRKCSKHAWSYEIRYRRNGYNIVASAANLTDAKARFIEKLKNAEKGLPQVSKVPQTFQEFALFYFANYRKKKVAEQTYRSDMSRFKNHIAPHFGSVSLKHIIPSDCNSLLNALMEKRLYKTAEEVYGLLNTIFKGAIAHHIISTNPMDIIPAIDHAREHGTALSKEEEKILLEAFADTKYERFFAIALYTGLRPNEYPTARIDGSFIVAKNSKRKGKQRKMGITKKIPITPMLLPYLKGIKEINFATYDQMNARLKKILPKHKLYDLRTTFYTRCKECGISKAARSEFMGHSEGVLDEAYSDLSDEFLLQEGSKFKY